MESRKERGDKEKENARKRKRREIKHVFKSLKELSCFVNVFVVCVCVCARVCVHSEAVL